MTLTEAYEALLKMPQPHQMADLFERDPKKMAVTASADTGEDMTEEMMPIEIKIKPRQREKAGA